MRLAAGSEYPVEIGPGLLAELPELVQRDAAAFQYAVISDDMVGALHGPSVLEGLRSVGLRASLFMFPAGEAHKTREEWVRLTDELLASGFGRDSAVIALGGGVTGDLAGFVAATYMRGVPLVQVPTSLLAMIDASVGGKTGVDTATGKNLVGAFHAPRLVLTDPELSGTLPRAERAHGLVEALKHGAILDEGHFQDVRSLSRSVLDGEPGSTFRVVRRSVELKADVVGEDERESGVRKVLNFGHTVGHALEAASDFSLTHGEAVGLGMILEAGIGEALGVTDEGTAALLTEGVETLGLPTRVPGGVSTDRALDHLAADKKGRQGELRVVLIRSVGQLDPGGAWTHPVTRKDVSEALERLR